MSAGQITAEWALVCHACGADAPLGTAQDCGRCGGTLTAVPAPEVLARPWTAAERGVWRYRAWLPVPDGAERVCLGEGDTPLVEPRRVAGAGRALLKLETANPTLAFKDRPVSVAATVAAALGQEGLLCASTGNTAVSVAAYAARAGLPSVCVVPSGTPAAKIALALRAGTRLLEVDGGYSEAHALAHRLAEQTGWADLTSTYANPFMLEGDKTLGLELFEQLGERAPAAIIVPIGAGPLLAGIGKAFDELAAAGRTGAVPRLYGVQAAGCAPIARAFAEDAPVRPWTEPTATAAGAIADALIGYAADGDRTLAAIRASGGAAVAVGDDELRGAASDLGEQEGVSVELAAAGALAAYRLLRDRGELAPDEETVLVLTGHASKDLGALPETRTLGVVAPGDVDAAGRLLAEAGRG